MSIDTVSSPRAMTQHPLKAAEIINFARKRKVSVTAEPQAANENSKIQPEEVLDQIKSLAQDGLYSVRFERNDEMSEIVVKIFDNETQEVIRQLPSEELQNFKAYFAELIGNVVNTTV